MTRAAVGRLLVIATPLGNLDDLSTRARTALGRADRILCEDTRRTRKLLARNGIEARLVACHKFNEDDRQRQIAAWLAAGECLALVTDGGTPVVSDPGAAVVRCALETGAEVVPIPGPSAVTAVLSICGFAADRFVFDGFLPARPAERRRRLRELSREARTIVVFEAPHRIRAALGDLDAVFGARPLVLARELTKVHETVLRGTASEIAARLTTSPRGEITLVLAGAPDPSDAVDEPEARRLRTSWREALLAEGGDQRLALRRASRALGIGRAALYRALVEIGALDRESG